VITIETTAWRPAERLTSKAAITASSRRSSKRANPALIAAALGDVAPRDDRGRPQADVTRDTLYKALNKDGDPRRSALLGVTKALGPKIHVAA
jgi:probable addiction module antidote protein